MSKKFEDIKCYLEKDIFVLNVLRLLQKKLAESGLVILDSISKYPVKISLIFQGR